MTYHPLPDGNKRTGCTVIREFVARNDRVWVGPRDWSETGELIEGIAAGTVSEAAAIAWIANRIAPRREDHCSHVESAKPSALQGLRDTSGLH